MGAKTFIEILKFNPYHGRDGRFSTSGSYTSFTYSPGKSKAHDLAIQREKERTAGRMPTEAQAKTLKGIENRTRNLKKEQFRVVDREGNIIMEKQGEAHSVNFTVGEARDNFPGNITIHNHPGGGTFSPPDLSAIGYGAKEIRAASAEGTYIMRNSRYGAKYDAAKEKTWYEMRNDIEKAAEGFKTDRQLRSEIRKPYEEQLKPYVEKWTQRKAEGASWDELNQIAAEHSAKLESFKPEIEAATRKAYVDQYHKWYKENAGKYGIEYEFIPVRSRARKGDGMDGLMEWIGKSGGEIVLDQDLQDDVEKITDEILEELRGGLPMVQKSEGRTFSIYKSDEDKRLVFGWASVSMTADGEQLEDRQGDMIDPEDMENSAYQYVLNFRDTGEEHIPSMRKKGKLVESVVFTKEKQAAMGIPAGILPEGWWVGFHIDDDDAWEKVKNGTYRMFSVEGVGTREPVEKAARNFDQFPGFWEWLEENMDATKEDEKAAEDYYGGRTHKKVAKTFHDVMKALGAPVRTISKADPERFDHIVEIEKFNPYHGADGRFASAGGAASFTYSPGKSKAHDNAIARAKEAHDKEIAPKGFGATKINQKDIEQGPTKHSLAKYMDENGNLTPEREELHKQIVREFLSDIEKAPDGVGTYYMMGGGPASGKSTVIKQGAVNVPDKKKAVYVDSDEIKAKLPEYQEMVKAGNKEAARFCHEESSALAKRISSVAQQNGYNVVLDGTGDGSVEGVRKKIAEAKANGMKAVGVYVTVPTDVAWERSAARAAKTGRDVPEEVVRGTHKSVSKILPEVAADFDDVQLFSTDGEVKLIAHGGNGKGLTATDKKLYGEFLAKGNE